MKETILFLSRSYCISCVLIFWYEIDADLIGTIFIVYFHNYIIFKENNAKGTLKPLFIAFFVSLILCVNSLSQAIMLLKLSYISFRVYFILFLANDSRDCVNSWSGLKEFSCDILKILVRMEYVIEFW